MDQMQDLDRVKVFTEDCGGEGDVTNVPVGPFLYFYVSEDCVNAK